MVNFKRSAKCEKCKNEFTPEYIEQHHIVPISITNNHYNSTTINLCKGCHRLNINSIHHSLPEDLITESDFINFTTLWLKSKQINFKKKGWLPTCQIHKRKMFVYKVRKKDVILRCAECPNKEIISEELYPYYIKQEEREAIKSIQKNFYKWLYNLKEVKNDSIPKI